MYFFSYRMAVRYHISERLLKQGWKKTLHPSEAIFTDDNLTLNDDISKHLEYKHLLAKLIKKHCPNVMPITYWINDNNYSSVFSQIIYNHYLINGKYERHHPALKWILKPSMLNNGDQIKLFNNIEEVKRYYSTSNRLGGDHVLQQYITNPDLIEGRKYTFRLPVIITNYAGVFLNRQGYVNISAVPFDTMDSFQTKKMHITNYVLDGEFANITQRSTQALHDFSTTFQKMSDIVQQCILALIKEHPDYLKPQKQKRFEVFGFDFAMDNTNRVWLLEINQGPDAPTFEENAMNAILWEPFWNAIIDDFVIPISYGTPPKNNYVSFYQVLSHSESYSPLKYWLHALKHSFS